jgi:adenylate cyclase
MNATQSAYRFGPVEVRPAERALTIDGVSASVGARAFDVLVALIERRERVVSKEELLDIVWPGLVVEENNLSVQISALRKLLGAQTIATVTGRGYRFVAPLGAAAAASALVAPQAVARRLAAVVALEVMVLDAALQAPAAGGNGEHHSGFDTGGDLGADWQAVRDTLVLAAAANADGRAVELTPETSLLEFASAVSAARWAREFQADLAEWRASGASRLTARIGIVVGDMIVEEGRMLGDTVHMARAMCSSACWDEVVVSPAMHLLARHNVAATWCELSEVSASGNTLRAIAMQPADDAAHAAAASAPRPPSRRAPGLAVLPFDCEVDQNYFGDGITEEIIASLSSNRSLFVIARHSTLRYRGSHADLAQIAAELNVRYLLQGSVRRQGERIRITAELVDAPEARAIWSERFDRTTEDLFDIQARIAARIAGEIDPWVQNSEIAHAAERPTTSLSAYECVLRGLSLQFRFDDESFARAGQLFHQAVVLDPAYAQAHAHLAWWHNLRFGEGRGSQAGEDGHAALRCARRALELDGRDAWVLSAAGHIHSFVARQFDQAMTMFDQALLINPNCASAWARSATTLAYIGRGEEAIERVSTALRLSPFDPQNFARYTTHGTASLVCGRPDEAVGWFGKARALNPGYRAAWRLMVAALALAGELEEARQLGQEFLQVDPAFRIGDFGRWYPMQAPHLDRVLQGLRLAGLPE